MKHQIRHQGFLEEANPRGTHNPGRLTKNELTIKHNTEATGHDENAKYAMIIGREIVIFCASYYQMYTHGTDPSCDVTR